MERHKNLLDHLTFPVFAADQNGRIFYKNDFVKRGIGMMRRGSRIMRYLPSGALPEASGLVYLWTPSGMYSRALLLMDEKEYLFLCFPRLQYEDAETVARHLLSILPSATPSSLFRHFENITEGLSKEQSIPPRLGMDVQHLTQAFAPSEPPKATRLAEFIDALFEKTSSAFCALGYDIQCHISPDLLCLHPLNLSCFDFLSLYRTSLYCAMKLSENGRVAISLTSDPEKERHILSFDVISSRLFSEDMDMTALFYAVIPECAPEFAFMPVRQRMDIFHFSLSQTLPQRYRLRFEFPYLAATHNVHCSLPCGEQEAYFTLLFSHIYAMLQRKSHT